MSLDWDLPTPFVIDIEVDATDIDEYAHANNTAYLRWVERVSWVHSECRASTWLAIGCWTVPWPCIVTNSIISRLPSRVSD